MSVRVASSGIPPHRLALMPNSGVEMLNRCSLSLRIHKNVQDGILILIDKVDAKRTVILIKFGLFGAPLKREIHVVGGSGERNSAGGVSRCNYPSLTGISAATAIIFPVKRKSICTDVYEEGEERRKAAAEMKG